MIKCEEVRNGSHGTYSDVKAVDYLYVESLHAYYVSFAPIYIGIILMALMLLYVQRIKLVSGMETIVNGLSMIKIMLTHGRYAKKII